MHGTQWLLKSMKGKSSGSARWLRRQLNDPLVKKAKRHGYRSRAAFKLTEINQKHQVIHRGDVVLDLGAAPGGWTQLAVEIACPAEKERKRLPSKVIAIDLRAFDGVDGAAIIVGDFRKPAVRSQLDEVLGKRQVDVVLSDMAPSFSGNFLVDSQSQIRLCYNALKMADLYLAPGGNFVTKILRSDETEQFRSLLKAQFDFVKAMKPLSSRSESTEMFLIAKGFRRPHQSASDSDATCKSSSPQPSCETETQQS